MVFAAVLASFAAGPVLAAATPEGTKLVESAKTLMTAEDLQGSLADAEAAVTAGGGAAAYAARAKAKRALGHPIAEVIEDSAVAVRMDSSSYVEAYNGLIIQRDSEANPDKSKKLISRGLGGIPMFIVWILAATGGFLTYYGVYLSRAKKKSVKASEAV